jgi:hypothetical protein
MVTEKIKMLYILMKRCLHIHDNIYYNVIKLWSYI